MKHVVITIGCEYGAGGPEIGQMLASALGVEYYDRDLVDSVVKKLNIDQGLVEKADEQPHVNHTFQTTLGPRYANLTNQVISTQYEVIHKMAEKGSCVIIGRSSDFILKDRKDVLNIFVYAPKDVRVRSIMERKGVDEKRAKELVDYYDVMNHSRHKYITGTYRGDRHNRHILIDSSLLGWEKTAQYLLSLVEICQE